MPKGVSIDQQPEIIRAKPRGRPPAIYRDKLIRQGDRMRALMEKVVRDPTHPWHDEHAPRFVLELAKMATPKLTALEGKDGDKIKFADVQAMLFMDAIEAEFTEVELDEASETEARLLSGPPTEDEPVD
jgi:hypothetical protein